MKMSSAIINSDYKVFIFPTLLFLYIPQFSFSLLAGAFGDNCIHQNLLVLDSFTLLRIFFFLLEFTRFPSWNEGLLTVLVSNQCNPSIDPFTVPASIYLHESFHSFICLSIHSSIHTTIHLTVHPSV